MSSTSSDIENIPPDITYRAVAATNNLLPAKSNYRSKSTKLSNHRSEKRELACGLNMLRIIVVGLLCIVFIAVFIISIYLSQKDVAFNSSAGNHSRGSQGPLVVERRNLQLDHEKNHSRGSQGPLVTTTERRKLQLNHEKRYCKDVKTESGLVRGCVDAGGNYLAFVGVPYAAPPTGTLRFKPPVKPDPWNEVLEGDPSVYCSQSGYGEENCLVINVFSPLKSLSQPLPVLAYIYGGAFLFRWAPTAGFQPLTEHNIIVVTLNYRLGPFGYLYLGTEKAPGNAGMKDQVAGLRWIKQNIANFGGDPNQVTIAGDSSGGACVELLVLSKQGKGLFHQAIVESGSAISVWATDLNPIRTAYDFAEKLGIPRNTNINALADYYQRAPHKVLTELNTQYYHYLEDGTFGFAPCVEKMTPVNDSEAFMTELPYDILMKENYDKVPMMYFFSSQEAINFKSHLFYNINYTERMSANFSEFLPADLIFDSAKTRDRIAQNIKDFYFGNKTIREDIMGFLKYYGDFLVLHGLLNSVEINSRDQNPVYLMKFTYTGGLGNNEKHFDFITESGHTDALKHALLRTTIKTEKDKKAVERVSTLVANFVKFGNPTPKKTLLLPIIWPRVIPGNVSCLCMGEEFKVINKPHWEAKQFWDVLYSKYRRKNYVL